MATFEEYRDPGMVNRAYRFGNIILSVSAGAGIYSSPREGGHGFDDYTKYEIAFFVPHQQQGLGGWKHRRWLKPSQIPAITAFAHLESGDDVIGWVPRATLDEIIAALEAAYPQ